MRLLSLKWLLLAAIGCTKVTDTDGVDTDVPTATCDEPESILLTDGSPSGFERCADGAVNRASAGTFDTTNTGPVCVGDEVTLSCTTDADCSAAPNGRCIHHTNFDFEPSCDCEYACASDADCDDGQACMPTELFPGKTRPVCVTAECATNDACASGECGLSSFDNGCGRVNELVCRDDADTCHSDADCEQGCAVEADLFACQVQDCDIGRPLLVDGEARTAPPTNRGDWAETLDFDLPGPNARATLAEHWARIGALEHASVASFARFTLQLLSLGAPPELVLAAQSAAADEVRHARVAYGLASKLRGSPVGPGLLPLADAAPAFEPAGVLFALIDEACVGETLGAAEAREAAELADPALRSALRGIAEDEARHAALAWRSLQWILDTHPELREAARDRLEATIARHADRARSARPTADLARWGRPASPAAVHLAALDRVVRPLVAALFESPMAIAA